MVMVEPEVAEVSISLIVGDDPQRADVLAEMLLMIERGIQSGQITKTAETIDLLVELAFLESREYSDAVTKYRAIAEGRLRPNGEIAPREAGLSDTQDDQRRDNAMQLGEHLAAILENPETPADIHDRLADAMHELIDDTSPGVGGDIRQNWNRIAEKLLAGPRPERAAKP